MEKRILLEKRGRSDDEITELILDNCRSTYIDGLTDSFTALETLSLINVGLVSLKNFPKLSNLRKLELSDNRISNGLNHLTGSPKLTHLNLSGNRIKDFDELQPLKDLENLEVLDLFNNQVTLIENYREKLFQLIPSLNYLDGFDKEYVEAPSDEEDMAGGVDDDDDDGNLPQPSQFSINGIEIDLDELEQLEARVRQKRTKNESDSKSANEIGSDVLEGHLGRTKSHSDDGCSSQTGQESTKDDLDLLYEEIQHKQALARANDVEQGRQKMASFVSVLLMFTSLLAFINQISYRGENQLLDEPEELVDDEEEENEEQKVEDMAVEEEKDECCSLGATGDSNASVEALPQMENGATAPSDATILAVAADDRPARADQN
ncbi:acidic leucine-rich nuclear phosphoprotein 32 family member A isoform X1 [Anopheles arabiensis]|uniref:acidic leucine-rich nuclear phosphoprotein 32 family member A isoform X1 n=1 Tax=Anopheles arabiensis TaxID=7173 RepID=UPI001AADF579|nr:acidic leucine-rich nuclear phosphoprotein 32 family member A isoform X1 [Anopheles arabiensis]XP_040176301.1 acidic leucine-rich nuclear phosphoprotein 32 family member A isoform X1 [Anopheles arabiensis]XP_040176302.1 acidic leucine-rich nuclear phosphoprotein 32 family member A isoform X1 [Anopheles arabiensis]XP_040176303.1 acidic leucine-rich nuclear phosphoprotein 32 family member A isoform X1 [Anopheles arabiensis]XP_040176304.1 acidic leucine-rich nuclear phosphoprotein 32 family mem